MANPEDKTFQCNLIDPTGKLLDCRVTSVVLPAHDGQLGILHDHMPMLCQLGLGIMKVTPAAGAAAQPPSAGSTPGGGGATLGAGQNDVFFFIDGGCALVAQNSVSVIAYDALALQDASAERIQPLIDKTTKNIADPALSSTQRAHESQRLRALQRITESHEGT